MSEHAKSFAEDFLSEGEPAKPRSLERTGSAIPEPLFSCSCPGCSEECTYPANMLYWLAAEKRWVCDNCWDQLDPINEDGEGPKKGETLEAHIRRVDPRAVDLLQNSVIRPNSMA